MSNEKKRKKGDASESCYSCDAKRDEKTVEQFAVCAISNCTNLICSDPVCRKYSFCNQCKELNCDWHRRCCDQCDSFTCNNCSMLDQSGHLCNHCYRVSLRIRESDSEEELESEDTTEAKKLRDALHETYMNHKITDVERQTRIFNLCALLWQDELTGPQLESRKETYCGEISPDGHVSPMPNETKTK